MSDMYRDDKDINENNEIINTGESTLEENAKPKEEIVFDPDEALGQTEAQAEQPDHGYTSNVNEIPYTSNIPNYSQRSSATNIPEQNPFVNNSMQQPSNEPFSYNPYTVPGSNPGDKFVPNDYDAVSENRKNKNRGLVVFLSLLVVVFAFTTVALGGMYLFKNSEGNTTTQNEAGRTTSGPDLTINSKPASEDEDVAANASGKLTVAQIAKRVRPSVVGIVAYSSQIDLQNLGGAQSSGSGVIMSEDGYIITNAHVIEGAARIAVVLDNGDEYEGKLIGLDTKTDLAVIKINKTNLTAAEFGDSSQVEVGEDVVAIGNPAGLELAGSLTKGIVSAVERPIQSSSTSYTMNCIQTDAAINPGNSGGALVNMYGQVIGINSAKISDVDYEGIGFAIASNDVKPVVDDLIDYGYVKGRAKIGITYQEITATYAQFQGIPAGLYVVSVDETLDVYKKGIRPGDIITEVDGKKITGAEVMTDYLKNKKAGDKIKLTIYRYKATGDSQTFTVSVQLAEDKGTTSSVNDNN